MLLHEVLAVLDEWFPPKLAEDWDNVGLLVGDRRAEVTRIMTCLTLTPESADEAITSGADLVVTHHPILFRAVKKLTADGPEGHVYRLIRSGVAVYSPHTAFDGAAHGINNQIAERLGLVHCRALRPMASESLLKVVVFVPESDLTRVQESMFEAGAGNIGEYSECGFRVTGTGSFRGSQAANPTIGQAGRREEVAEHRLEVLVTARCLDAVVAAIRSAHSYEEPAFDVYPLSNPAVSSIGAGRQGQLASPLSLEELARLVGDRLSAPAIEFVGDATYHCQRVAIGCGAGSEFLGDAERAGCDVLITGEARFHQYLEAQSRNIGLILTGHYASERFAVETLAERMAAHWPALRVWASDQERDPVHRVQA